MEGARRNLAVVIVTVQERALRTSIVAAIEKRLGRGPVRTGSDNSLHFPARFDEHQPFLTASTHDGKEGADPSVIVECAQRGAAYQPLISGVLRIDGRWDRGSPLQTPRAKLAALDRAGVDSLLSEVESILSAAREPYVNPVPIDTGPSLRERIEPRWAAPRTGSI